jgi:alkylation response protein AidB-like acyl-CoA dehydrogenase
MQLADTDQQREFRAGLRRWLGKHVPADTDEIDPERLRNWSRELHAAGYAGITWPTEHGGRGLPAAYQAIYAEESAAAGAPEHADTIGLNMVGPSIIRYGTPAQQSRYLPRILAGDMVFCQGFSEPGAGSDLAAVRTRATADNEGYRIEGEKVWSTGAHLADQCLLLARTSAACSHHSGLTCLLVDMRAPGVEVRPIRRMAGDSGFGQIVFTGTWTGADTVLGAVDDGWRVAMTTLAHERGTFGVMLTARLAAELGRLRRTVRSADAGRDPHVRREFAALHVELQGLRHTGQRALESAERTGQPGPESTILKLRWSEATQRAAALGVRVSARGDRAAMAKWAAYWSRRRLATRTATVEGGTSEILRGVVAERVLGLPRSR